MCYILLQTVTGAECVMSYCRPLLACGAECVTSYCRPLLACGSECVMSVPGYDNALIHTWDYVFWKIFCVSSSLISDVCHFTGLP